jgi:hypothetical protein
MLYYEIITIVVTAHIHKGHFKRTFWYLQIYQKSKEMFLRISAQASKKKVASKKIKALYMTN